MNKLFVITSNPGKLLEIQEKFKPLAIQVIQKNIGYPEIQADTLEEVAEFGVKWLQKRVRYPFILEDSGLFIDKLKGFPGVYSKSVFYTIGLPGVLKLLKDTEKNQRTAVFRSVIALCEPKKKPVLFLGECKGNINETIQGTNGFGYDPIFIPLGETRTFAQMTTSEKNQYSHRGKSLENLIKIIQKKRKKEVRKFIVF